MLDFYERIGVSSPVAVVIISVAFMLFFGYLMTRVTKLLRLPNVTAYIVTGILIGPFCLNLIPASVIEGTEFLADIALAFIAFGTGEFFRFSVLRKNGVRILVITLVESCLASVAVFVVMFFVLRLNFAFSVVLAALAAATAPASTVMTIRQTGAKGDFVNTLLQVVALDDVVGLLAYSIAVSAAVASVSANGFQVGKVIRPILVNFGVMLLGGVFGWFLKLLMKKRSTDNRLIISVALLFAFCGVSVMLDVSPLLGCMAMGTVYINLTGDDKLFKQLNYFSPPILLLFFVRSGLSFRLDSLIHESVSLGTISLLAVGILYFLMRIVGKYGGAFLGCCLAGKERRVRNYLGLALIPQAGVAIGLATIGARTLGGEMGQALQTVILSSSVLYELIGPACAKLSLYLSGSYSDRIEDLVTVNPLTPEGREKNSVELLTERIRKIQEQLPVYGETLSEEERAFNEAAEEQLRAQIPRRRPFGSGRR